MSIFSIEVNDDFKYKPLISSVIHVQKNVSAYLKYVYLSFDVNAYILFYICWKLYAAIG